MTISARTGQSANQYDVSERGKTEITNCPIDPKSHIADQDNVLVRLLPLNLIVLYTDSGTGSPA